MWAEVMDCGLEAQMGMMLACRWGPVRARATAYSLVQTKVLQKE